MDAQAQQGVEGIDFPCKPPPKCRQCRFCHRDTFLPFMPSLDVCTNTWSSGAFYKPALLRPRCTTARAAGERCGPLGQLFQAGTKRSFWKRLGDWCKAMIGLVD